MSLRLFSVFLTAFVIALTGCSSSSPENTVADFYAYIGAGKFDKAVKLIHIPQDELSKDEMGMMESKLGMMLGEMKKEMDKHQGLKEMKVRQSEVNSEGTQAEISVSLIFKDGSETEEEMRLEKVKGDWKILLK